MIHCVLEASQHFDLTALEMVANLSNSFSIPMSALERSTSDLLRPKMNSSQPTDLMHPLLVGIELSLGAVYQIQYRI
jgi:hypothetical protein